MNESKRLFISFSSADNETVRRIFYRLSALGFDVWDYSDIRQEIAGGSNIMHVLYEEIDRCDFFIPIVSANSFNSVYTRAEVRYALENKRLKNTGKIIPANLVGTPDDKSWPDPYDLLKGIRYRLIDGENSRIFENGIRGICDDTGGVYAPLIEPFRLPVFTHLVAEIEGKRPLLQDQENAIFTRLSGIVQDCMEHYKIENYKTAFDRIQYLIGMAVFEFPDIPMFYPYVVKGVLELHLQNIVDAQETFTRLKYRLENETENLQQLGSKAKKDLPDTIYAGLGQVYYSLGKLEAALEYFKIADSFDPDEVSTRLNKLWISSLIGRKLDAGDFNGVCDSFYQVDENEIQDEKMDLESKIRIINIKGAWLFNEGQYPEALEHFQAYEEMGIIDDTTLSYMADVSEVLAETAPEGTKYMEEAARKIEKWVLRDAEIFGTPDIIHRLAYLYTNLGWFEKAIDQFKELISKYPCNWQYRVEYARILRALNRQDIAEKVIREVLDIENPSLPSNSDDFYWSGYANFLVGRQERAAYDFERSGKPEEWAYIL